MNQFIQTLESRQMFSAAPITPRGLVGAPPAVPHVTATVNRTIYFQGTALNSNGSLDADLLMTLKPSGKGDAAQVLVCNPNGKITTVNIAFNAAGQCSYSDTQDGDTTTFTGQLSPDKQTITATVTHSNTNGTSTGSANCTRTNTAPTVVNYTGTMRSGKKHVGLKAELVKTSTGYFGVLTMVPVNPNSNNNGLFITVGSTGTFTATGANDGNPTLVVTGQLSGNGKTLSGTFTGLVVDGTTINGTFSLNRN